MNFRRGVPAYPSDPIKRSLILPYFGVWLRSGPVTSGMPPVGLTWDLIIGWAEADRVFALFPSPISFLPIPKRAMTDDQQKELRTILQKKFAGGK